jgi:cell division protein FtsZ
VNEACSLIRGATSNEDAQINFGVVLNESLKDTVKITVIATGFQRDNLPQLARRASASASSSISTSMVEPLVFENLPPAPTSAPPPEPLFSTGLSSGSSLFRESVPVPEPEVEPEISQDITADDLEVPAFMRRERRLYQ